MMMMMMMIAMMMIAMMGWCAFFLDDTTVFTPRSRGSNYIHLRHLEERLDFFRRS